MRYKREVRSINYPDRLTIKVSYGWKDKVASVASRQGLGLAEFVRQAVEKAVTNG